MDEETYEYIDGYRSSCKYYLKGNVNIILSATHGGSSMPDDVLDRTESLNNLQLSNTNNFNIKTVKDTRTDEFTDNVSKELHKIWNFKPFVVIGEWHRCKVDFNRDIFEATLNQSEAITAYENYHMNLNNAIHQVNQLFGKGLLIDIHGHSQGNYTMLGYTLSKDQLNHNDLSRSSYKTSIESLCNSNRNECIRGQTSFGSIFERYGLGIAYPSSTNPKPGSHTYFPGGYIIRNYCSKINAIQVELPYDIRTGGNTRMNAEKFAHVIIDYMKIHNLLLSQ